MTFVCPKCNREVGLRLRACPICGFRFTWGPKLRAWWKRLRRQWKRNQRRRQEEADARWKKTRRRWKRRLAMTCPNPECQAAVSLFATKCPKCGKPVTVDVAVKNTVDKPKRKWLAFLRDAKPVARRRIQWIYLLISGALLWWKLEYSADFFAKGWWQHALLAVVYLAVLILVFRIVVPRNLIEAVSKRATVLVKCGLVCNYLTLLLLLQSSINEWWPYAIILALPFGITLVAALLFKYILRPVILGKEKTDAFDPSAPQGRSGRFD